MLRLTSTFRAQLRPFSRAGLRYYSEAVNSDIRKQLTDELKASMRSKDTVKSTTIRSVLSEVYSADKTQPEPLAPGAIISIIRKGITRRTDAAAEFDKASRPDLAEKERKEVGLLQIFVPPLLPEADIDRVLQEIIAEHKVAPGDKRALGQVFKAFYSKIDRSQVDADLVKQRATALLS